MRKIDMVGETTKVEKSPDVKDEVRAPRAIRRRGSGESAKLLRLLFASALVLFSSLLTAALAPPSSYFVCLECFRTF